MEGEICDLLDDYISLAEPPAQYSGGMNWKQYHRLSVIYSFMDEVASRYPEICKVIVIGTTAEGREMKLLKISTGRENNRVVWVDGATHAREWISAAVVTYLIHSIVSEFYVKSASVTNKDWYMMPVVNPDGYEYSHTHDRMWRKNRNRYGDSIGVDLNRNFSVGWSVDDEEGSSSDPDSLFFRGPEPFSESETKAIKDFITSILAGQRKFLAFLSYHSYGEAIIFPWGHREEPCPDYIKLLLAAASMSKSIKGTNGRTYRVGSTKDLMSLASGVSSDWSYSVGVPYSFMVEVSRSEDGFHTPEDQILSVARENLAGLQALMTTIDLELGVGYRRNIIMCDL